MRPRNLTARDQLTTLLARHAPTAAAELAGALGVSVPTVHRMLDDLGESVISAGKARRARYALRRALRGDAGGVPVYEIDRDGHAVLLNTLELVHPHGSCLALNDSGWPIPDESRDGWWAHLPYPIADMRPQGYMGRQFARAQHAGLRVSEHPREWSDDDLVYVSSRSGVDVSGNLLLGDPAIERWQAAKLAPPTPLDALELRPAYAQLAEQAIGAGHAGAWVAGEFPKFAALRERTGAATPHVLVKFSGAGGSPAVQRWADLLVAEHLALECAREMPGVCTAVSRIVTHAGRTFLEVERFDRHGLFGRSRLISLVTLDATLLRAAPLGSITTDWTALAASLEAMGLISGEHMRAIHHLWWFGRLIANTDMHTDNLSFKPQSGRLELAPAYDMLPMLHAPLPGGELPTRAYEPPLPLPAQRDVWNTACAAALAFWDSAVDDARISAEFRAICAVHAAQLRAVAELI